MTEVNNECLAENTLYNNNHKIQEILSPREKFMDEFLGCRRRERLQPIRTTPKNQKAFLGTLWASKECLARIRKW
ncbi:hypothetical protein [Photobacterium halotolerans]|uniref:hypothetical protein n=1 Tax=Photobacterium halotolerans TaxID=265726 RepID=UPI000487B904|nr:hypothetical protein [Photobacterium halotolerans]